MKISIPKTTTQKVTVSKYGSILNSSDTSMPLKNQISEITSIEQMKDVVAVNVIDGSSLYYDSASKTFQIKPSASNTAGIDGGTF